MVCETDFGPSVFDGAGREVFCDNLGEANYLCGQLNKEGDRFVGGRSDFDLWNAFVDKTIKDYYEKPIHIERGLHPKARSKKLKNKP